VVIEVLYSIKRKDLAKLADVFLGEFMDCHLRRHSLPENLYEIEVGRSYHVYWDLFFVRADCPFEHIEVSFPFQGIAYTGEQEPAYRNFRDPKCPTSISELIMAISALFGSNDNHTTSIASIHL
jgi:hypothetical protein